MTKGHTLSRARSLELCVQSPQESETVETYTVVAFENEPFQANHNETSAAALAAACERGAAAERFAQAARVAELERGLFAVKTQLALVPSQRPDY